ncbi:MAG: hypothetical protein GX038_02240, partial [Erysipelothrix sp.]|nr:hypothetical protein [Erysipelothrix sp.]
LDMGIGYVEFPNSVRLSGKVWQDTNFDGIKQDEELGETDREVTLWKREGNDWKEHKDLNGNSTVVTNELGQYVFNVSPTNYNPLDVDYLSPHKYRINVKRSANEVFSPYLQGTDITSDSNIEDLDLTGKTLSANSDNFDINELVNGKVNIAKVKADNNMGVGIKTFETSAILGGTVWKDSTYDGYMSTDEERLAGRSVTLWKREGNDWKEHKDLNGNSTVVTNELGQYEFKVSPTNYNPLDVDYLSPYKYRISIERGVNEAFSRPRNVSNDPMDETDSNIELRDLLAKDLAGFSHEFTIYDVVNGKVDITSIKDDKTIGAGINVYDNLVLIGGKVWDDSDFDGIMSDDEVKVENQPITLWFQEPDARWTDINETTTDENGNYIFTAVPAEYDTNSDHYLSPFVYKVSTPRKGNESFSSYKEGTDSTRDSNVNDTIDLDGNKVYEHIGISDAFSIIDVINVTGKVDISSVRDDMDMGIGIKKNPDTLTLGGTVWHDLDEDGIMLDDEVRIADREVILQELIDNAWVDIDSVLTNEDGEYRFENIAPTYYDFNSPNYLVPRSYRITFTRNGYEVFSPMNVGTDNTVDSDIDAQAMFIQNHIGISNTFKIFEAVNGKVDVNTIRDDIHMGVGLNVYKNTALIGGVLWNDNNRNGLKDADEALIENKEVELWRYEPVDPKNPKGEGRWVLTEDVKGNHTVLTDELGQYEFEVLPTNYDNTADDYLHVYTYIALVKRSGDQVWTLYELENGIDSDNYFDNIEALKGYSQNGLPKDAGYGLTNVFDIVDYDEDYIIDINSVRDISMMDGGLFIYNNLAQIGDKVWHDINENGIQDHNESGIKDVVVKLQQYNTATGTWFNIYDEQGLDSYVTQSDGKYLFTVQAADLDLDSDTYLSEHQYRVMIEIPNGMEATIMHNDELLNSDHISQDGMLLTSRNAKVFASTDDGLIENTEVMDDLDIDFGLVLVKDGSTKVPTGESYSILLPSLLVLTVGILSIVIIKRKEELEQED